MVNGENLFSQVNKIKIRTNRSVGIVSRTILWIPITRPTCTGKDVHDKQTIRFDKADQVIQAIQVCTTDKKKKDDRI
ncbi:MAG TPA: hypothetical protein DD706_12265 [Nitrospiraceae bacterium]|nr:hypothetical protein [Nitrospiraceae bacterium]